MYELHANLHKCTCIPTCKCVYKQKQRLPLAPKRPYLRPWKCSKRPNLSMWSPL